MILGGQLKTARGLSLGVLGEYLQDLRLQKRGYGDVAYVDSLAILGLVFSAQGVY